MEGPVDCRGKQVYSPFLYDTGIDADAIIPGLLNIKAGMLGLPTIDMEMDLNREALLAEDPSSSLGDTFNWTNLNTFSGNGGKLIFYHGVSDPWFSVMDTVTYYENIIRDNGGAENVSKSCRLFLVPGMGHCSGGEKTMDQFDMLSAIVDWVEKDEPPDSVFATGRAYPGSSRPLCPYPKYPHYTGREEGKSFKNYECR
jgi:feruloyl esterase